MGVGHQGRGVGPQERLAALVAEGRVRATADMGRLGECDVISICVPTPLNKIKDPDLSFVTEAVRLSVAELGSTPLIGFAGSPWTVATYMVEGGSSREFARIKGLAREEPAVLERLLEVVAAATTDHLNAQSEAGAQVLMIFDTWGGVLAPDDYRRFSLVPMQRILDGLERQRGGSTVPVILFTKGAGPLLADMSETGCDALGVDWTTDLATARELTRDRVALQGNLEPALLKESPQTIDEAVARVLESYGRGPGHVFNLGHGITPDIDPDHLRAMLHAVHRLSPPYHQPGVGPT